MLNAGEARHAASTEASGTSAHLQTTPRPTSIPEPAKSFNPTSSSTNLHSLKATQISPHSN
eukprot:2500611-Rhodomonas_salina.1